MKKKMSDDIYPKNNNGKEMGEVHFINWANFPHEIVVRSTVYIKDIKDIMLNVLCKMQIFKGVYLSCTVSFILPSKQL